MNDKPIRATKARKNNPELAERRRRAVELRLEGVSYEDIAVEVGLKSAGGAHRLVARALEASYREPADELRTLELERLDSLTRALWSKCTGEDPITGKTSKINLKAVDRAVRVMERRAKLLGLDAPVKQDITTNGEAVSTQGTVIILPDNGRDRPEELEQDADGPDSVPGTPKEALPRTGADPGAWGDRR
jgi:hypothetical protein